MTIIFFIFSASLCWYVFKMRAELKNQVKSLFLSENKKVQLLENRLATKKSLESLGQLTASLAHEIKNPINLILNSSKILNHEIEKNCELPENISKMPDIIYKNSIRVNEIIRNLLRHSSDMTKVKFEILVFKPFVYETIEIIQDEMESLYGYKVDIKIKYDIPDHYMLRVSRVDFTRLFRNIIENGYHSINKKRKQVQGYEGHIEARVSMDKENIYLCYYDNGLGVSEENITKISKPFFTTKSSGEGIGLGLFLIHEITQLHSGSLEIESVENEFFKLSFQFAKYAFHEDN